MTLFTNPLIRILIIMFLLLLLLLLLFIAGEMILSRRRANRNRTQAITATVTDIHIEADNTTSGWVLTAQWFTPFSPQPLVFVSPYLSHRPPCHAGDTILIYINPNNPRDYSMQLND